MVTTKTNQNSKNFNEVNIFSRLGKYTIRPVGKVADSRADRVDSIKEGKIMSEEVEENVPIFLSFSNLGVKINGRQILQNVSGKVHPGEMLAVMGPSGKRIILFCSARKLVSLVFSLPTVSYRFIS